MSHPDSSFYWTVQNIGSVVGYGLGFVMGMLALYGIYMLNTKDLNGLEMVYLASEVTAYASVGIFLSIITRLFREEI